VRDEIRLRAVRPDGARVTLGHGAVTRDVRAWLRNFWADAGEPLQASAGEGIAAAVAGAMATDGAGVRRLDPKNAMLLGWLDEGGAPAAQ